MDRYAEAVLDGGVMAGPYVRMTCERHIRDRARAAEGQWYQFSEARADHLLDYFESCLRLPDVLDANGEPEPFLLSVGTRFWEFILGSLFGWVGRNGHRRFREGYIESGKGSAKTPVLGGVGLYGLMMDGERAAEIYAGAADQDQAMILFRDAVRIGQASPEIREELEFDGGAHIWQIRHPESLSFFRTFSREGGHKSGPRPHFGLMDELHEQPTPETSVKMRAGAKRRPQPMLLEITNSGYDRASICWQRHEHARRVVEQVVDDEQLFAYVCALDAGDDPIVDPSCWPKTNPYIGVSVTQEYLQRQVANAKSIPSEMNNVLRLNFCVWTNQHTRFIDMAKWQACAGSVKASELVGVPCYAGLDLGQSDDFSAFVRVWVLPDGRFWVVPTFWMPSAAIQRFQNRPLAEWQRAKALEIIPDSDVIDYGHVEARVLAVCEASGVREVAYDKRFAEQMAQNLTGAGVTMVNVAQGFQLTEALRKLSDIITNGTLVHDGNPILGWMADNLVVKPGRDGAMRPDKDKAGEKIDGQVALTMALEAVIRQPQEPEATYQMYILGGSR